MSTFKAAQVTELKGSFAEAISSLSVHDVERKRELKPFEVRISVRASALNFFDLLQMVGKYQMKPPLPFTLGAEGAGVVTQVGQKAQRFKVGDRVMFGMVLGGIAEEVILPESALLPAPSTLTWAECAAFPVGYLTAYHGVVTRGHLKANETVLITGAAGGMGLTAIQVAKCIGATVIAAASSPEKLAMCKTVGADHLVNYSKDNLRDRGRGVDVVYDVVGGKIFKETLRCVAGGARVLVIGFTSGEIPQVPANIVLVKGISIVGVRSGAELMMSPALMKETTTDLLKWANEGKLKPPIQKEFDLSSEGVREAFSLLAERKAVGKIVIRPSQGNAKL